MVDENTGDDGYPTDPSMYELGEEIGRGSGATVYKAVCRNKKPSDVAIKIKHFVINPSRGWAENPSHPADNPSHPNILRPHCSFFVDYERWVVMPLMPQGSILSAYTGGLPETFLSEILKQVLLALTEAMVFPHGNIKPGNIFVDASGSAKLADQGHTASLVETYLEKKEKAYWEDPPPGQQCPSKLDTWSFGVTALELARGGPPVSQLPPQGSDMLARIRDRFRVPDPDKLKRVGFMSFSPSFKNMVRSCLDADPHARPSFKELLEHPFFDNCKGFDRVLIKNLPEVKLSSGDWGVRGGCYEKGDAVVMRWVFNEETLEFDPVYG